jgi:hypothetical protein
LINIPKTTLVFEKKENDSSLLVYAIRVIVTFQQFALRVLSELFYLLLCLRVGILKPFFHLFVMELEAILLTMIGPRVVLLIFLPLFVDLRLQIIPKEFSIGLPGV